MKKLLTILEALTVAGVLMLAASQGSAQTFPSGIYTPKVAANNLQTTLTANVAAGDTSIIVASTTRWAANMYAYVCDTTTVTAGVARCSGTFEVMLVTSVGSSVLLNVTRAQDGTTAISHASGKAVINAQVAAYSNLKDLEITAIETALGTNLSNIPTSPVVGSATYNFAAQAPTSPATLTAGSRTITFPSGCPLGVNGTDSGHRLAILGGGTNEAALITGGTCTSGAASGNITLTVANSHSAGYTIASATAGIQEAIQVLNTSGTGGRVYVPKGAQTIYGPIAPPHEYTYWIEGTGRSSTVLNVATTFCNPSALVCTLATNGVFDFSPSQPTATAADAGGVVGLTIGFTQPDSTNLALYTQWPPAIYASGTNHVTADWVLIERAWDAITSPLSNGVTVSHVGMSFFHRGISVDVCSDILSISHVEAWVFGLASNQSTLFRDPAASNYFLDIQQADYAMISNIVSVSGKFATFRKNGSGSVPVINGTDWDIDTNGGFEMSNGYIRLANVNVSLLAGTAAFSISGGTLAIDGLGVFNSGSTTAVITYNPSQTNAGAAAGVLPGVFINGLHVSSSTEDQRIVYATTSGAFAGVGTVQIHGGTISRSPGQAYTLPLFQEVAGTGSVVMDIQDLTIITNAGVAAVAFNFASANRHTVMNVKTSAGSGWSYTVPVATTVWFNNPGFTSSISTLLDPLQLTGHLTFSADNTYDVGATGATRPRNGFFGTSLTVGATGGYIWNGLSQILSPSDGVIRLSNNAGTAFSRLQFGGTSTSFPALKRSSDTLHVRLADDSAFAGLQSSFLQTNAASGMDIYLRGATASFPAIKRTATAAQFRLADDSGDAPLTSGAFTSSSLLPLVGPNYIASETGANNAIAGALLDATGTAVPVAAGLCVTVQLGHTLQAGANTFALNGGTARSIVSSRNTANNIGTAYAATGRTHLCYNTTGPVWMDMSQ